MCRIPPFAFLLLGSLSIAGCTPVEGQIPFGAEPSTEPEVTSSAFAEIAINEVLSSGDDGIELINLSNEAVDLGGYALLDGTDSHNAFEFAAGTMLAPGGLIYFTKDEHDLGLGDQDAVRLFHPDGGLVDETEWSSGDATPSWCRLPDGTGAWTVCGAATLGSPNVDEDDPDDNDDDDDDDDDDIIEDGPLLPLFVAGLDDWDEDEVEVRGPNELTFDGQGRLWAGDQKNLRVQVFDVDGSFLATVGGIGDGPGEFAWSEDGNRGPESMKLGPDGLMYVVDRIGRRINVYDPVTLSPLPRIELGGLVEDPTGFVISDAGIMYVADQALHQILMFDLDGAYEGTVQVEFDDAEILYKVETLALDEASDRLFATSENEELVEVYRLSTGEYLNQHITDEQEPGEDLPGRISDTIEGIAVDPVHRWFFICDEESGRFMVHDLDSDALTDPAQDFAFLGDFGTVGSGPTEFDSPDGIAISAAHDRLAIADQGNDRVQVFALSEIAEYLGLPFE